MSTNIYSNSSHDAISPDELQLYNMIMNYRAELGLPSIPLSKSLSTVASRHALDDVENANGFDGHSWTDAPYDANNPGTYANMWNAPQRLGTEYTGNGYEISTGFPTDAKGGYMSPQMALDGWKTSQAHNDVIANAGPWGQEWNAIGIGMQNGVAHVWFGHETDPAGKPVIEGAANTTLVDGSNSTETTTTDTTDPTDTADATDFTPAGTSNPIAITTSNCNFTTEANMANFNNTAGVMATDYAGNPIFIPLNANGNTGTPIELSANASIDQGVSLPTTMQASADIGSNPQSSSAFQSWMNQFADACANGDPSCQTGSAGNAYDPWYGNNASVHAASDLSASNGSPYWAMQGNDPFMGSSCGPMGGASCGGQQVNDPYMAAASAGQFGGASCMGGQCSGAPSDFGHALNFDCANGMCFS